MFISRKVAGIAGVIIVGAGGLLGYLMLNQKPVDSVVEVDKPVVDSNEISAQSTRSAAAKYVNNENLNDGRELEDINIKPDELSTETKLDRLIQLDNSINKKSEHFAKLVREYDQDLADTNKQKALSSALLASSEYRSDILQKFKVEGKTSTADF